MTPPRRRAGPRRPRRAAGLPRLQLGLISVLKCTRAQVSGGAPTRFRGLANYTELLTDDRFWQVLLATVGFAAACVGCTLAVGCAPAVLLTRVRAVPRLALLLAALGAWATPAITGSTVWPFLFDPDFGPVDRLPGLGDFSWTYGRYSAFLLVLFEVVRCSFPFVMITATPASVPVPGEVREAAALDGASQLRIWRSVLTPMLRPLLVIVTVQSAIWDFKVFTQIYVRLRAGRSGEGLTPERQRGKTAGRCLGRDAGMGRCETPGRWSWTGGGTRTW
ncbi:hypothetical protein GCM10010521_59870 [Streptomyces rameus]|uniref:Uncharacterized protein n=1 Tax=Streptomyces rameus TaxID=68261 RepID=A0ABN3V0C8_9ACTN